MSGLRARFSLQLELASTSGQDLDPRLLPLLRAIREHGSLQAACDAVSLSYRYAWGLLRAQAAFTGMPFVEMSRGRSARLTPQAARLLDLEAAARRRFAAFDTSLAPVAGEIAALATTALPAIVLAASHDLVVAQLPSLARTGARLEIDLSIKGTTESIAALLRGQSLVAGFHVPERRGHRLRREILEPLVVSDARVVEWMTREQGLLVAKGNPHGICRLEDLAVPGRRFVNRQRGSGTRLILDALLEDAGIAVTSIRGYDDEEFTHAAVAAMVASGTVDAGFGIAAAAAQFGLAFVPLTRDVYCFACRGADARSDPVRRLVSLIGSAPIRSLASRLPGYRILGGARRPVTAGRLLS
jgi:molybdate transport repressor ModE-like protein